MISFSFRNFLSSPAYASRSISLRLKEAEQAEKKKKKKKEKEKEKKKKEKKKKKKKEKKKTMLTAALQALLLPANATGDLASSVDAAPVQESDRPYPSTVLKTRN